MFKQTKETKRNLKILSLSLCQWKEQISVIVFSIFWSINGSDLKCLQFQECAVTHVWKVNCKRLDRIHIVIPSLLQFVDRPRCCDTENIKATTQVRKRKNITYLFWLPCYGQFKNVVNRRLFCIDICKNGSKHQICEKRNEKNAYIV